MIKKIPIRFYESSSIMVRLNPLVKLVWLVFLSILILWFNDYRIELGMLILTLGAFRLSNVDVRKLQGSRFVIGTGIIIGLFHLIFTHEGIPLYTLGRLSITSVGLQNALLVSSRFLSFVFMGYIFVITTEPNAFVYSLMQIKLPYRFGFAMITALRLIPIFANEVNNIFYAQVTRGVVYRLFPPGPFFHNVFQFLKVLLVSTVKKVDALVLSMEGRSFGSNPERTFSRRIGFSGLDKFLLIVACLTILLLINFGRDLRL